MPQAFFPVFSEGMVHINSSLAYQKEKSRVYYFNGHQMPVFSHDEADLQSFKMIMSQFCVNGNATQAEVIRAFGMAPITMKRGVKTFREQGPAGFYKTIKKTRKPRVLTLEVLSEVQGLLDAGNTPHDIAFKLNIKQNTIEKAIRSGRLEKKKSIHKEEIFFLQE